MSKAQDLWTIDECFIKAPKTGSTPIRIVSVDDYEEFVGNQSATARRWLEATRFRPRAGAHRLIPGEDGSVAFVLLTVSDRKGPWDYAELPRVLPRGAYELETNLDAAEAEGFCLGWALGSYRFQRYKSKPTSGPVLGWPPNVDPARVRSLAEGIRLCRDLINTPAADMGPVELAAAAHALAEAHDGRIKTIAGERLVRSGYPAIHAVGRASSREPVLIDLRWGKQKHPRLTLVGKGVCFDTGGLDIKPASNMKLMKKDMGGAALVLGLAHAIMSAKLPVRLRVLIPAVENAVSGDAFRPLDVLDTRKGITVEVGNTDAEGRLVLCDALAEADTEDPDLIVDVATLTGAARVALGTSVPAVFSRKNATAQALLEAGTARRDPLWRLPLYEPYRKQLDSRVADINNISNGPYGGAITAALFLAEFVSKRRDWVHIDTMGFNLEGRPGRPVGGEALGLLALEEMLRRRYGSTSAEAADEGPMPASTAASAKSKKKKKTKGKKKAAADNAATKADQTKPSKKKAPERGKKGSSKKK